MTDAILDADTAPVAPRCDIDRYDGRSPGAVATAADPARRAGLARALDAIRQTVTVATALRTLGALTVVGSLSLFLMQGLEAEGDLARVFVLLGQSALLGLAGLAVGYALREPKGARVFLTLGLVSVPANFAVLGAMIYSLAPLDGGTLAASYPDFALWQAGSPRELALALVSGVALLVPLAGFGFAVLARRMAVPLTLGLLGASAALLVPVRDPALVALLGGAALVGVATLVLGTRRRSAEGSRPLTFEERLAQALLFLPTLLLLGRSLMIHGVDVHTALPLAAAAYWLLRRFVRGPGATARTRRVAAVGAGVAAATTALLLVPLIAEATTDGAALPAFAAISGLLMLGIGGRFLDAATRRALGGLWSALTLVALVPCALFAITPLESAAAIGVAAALLVHGVLAGGTVRTVLGALALCGVLWLEAGGLVSLVLAGGWRALAGVGIATIVAGSALERYGPALRLGLARRRAARITAGDEPLADPECASPAGREADEGVPDGALHAA